MSNLPPALQPVQHHEREVEPNPELLVGNIMSRAKVRVDQLYVNHAPDTNELENFTTVLRMAPDTPLKACFFMALGKKTEDSRLFADALMTILAADDSDRLKTPLLWRCARSYKKTDQQLESAAVAELIVAKNTNERRNKFDTQFSAAMRLMALGLSDEATQVVESIDAHDVNIDYYARKVEKFLTQKPHNKVFIQLASLVPSSKPLPKSILESLQPGTAFKPQSRPDIDSEPGISPESPGQRADWSAVSEQLPEIGSDMERGLANGSTCLEEYLRTPWRHLYMDGERVLFRDTLRTSLGFEHIELKDNKGITEVAVAFQGALYQCYLSKNARLDANVSSTLSSGQAALVRYMILAELKNLLCTPNAVSAYVEPGTGSGNKVLRRTDRYYELPLGHRFTLRALMLAKAMRGADLHEINRTYEKKDPRRCITYRSAVRKPGAPTEPITHIRTH